jgi:hypothetical protein
MNTDLSGDDFFNEEANLPTGSRRPMRGRPRALDDATLQNRRDRFVQLLESVWPEIGWELQIATTVEDLRRALTPLATDAYGEIRMFVRPVIEVVGSAALGITRKQLRNAVRELEALENIAPGQRARLQQAAAAVEQRDESPRFARVRFEHAARHEELRNLNAKIESLKQQKSELRGQLANQEASFSQQELRQFIASQRYSLEPLNFANAIAGLPQIGWRQSFKRCCHLPCDVCNSTPYQVFVAVRRAVQYAPPEITSFLDRVKAWLLNPTQRRVPAALELKKNWYYLKKAIESFQEKRSDSRSLPFHITAEYQRSMRNRSSADLIIAEDYALN